MDVLRLQRLGPDLRLSSFQTVSTPPGASGLGRPLFPLTGDTSTRRASSGYPDGKGGPQGPGPAPPGRHVARAPRAQAGRGASAPARHDAARLLPKAAAGLSEAGGGQAASSRDGPPTRHIRAAGLSPGPARLWPLALTRNTPPYGLPQGG